MRLTLRTLLAWLDGVLPDDEQQQLGAKVSSSAMATHLVERIRGAVGRAAIGAPKLEGRGLTEDINSVAEYLDNTLSSEQLEAFERICIESEVHLAEVAACHGLLAEVSRDPTVAQRLYEEERERIHQRLLGLLSGLQDRAATEKITAAGDGDGHHGRRDHAQQEWRRHSRPGAVPAGGWTFIDCRLGGRGVRGGPVADIGRRARLVVVRWNTHWSRQRTAAGGGAGAAGGE
jgi:hypothetical protein